MEGLAAAQGRSVVYAAQIEDLLAREEKVFRIDATTIGVSGFQLISAAVSARPVLASERSVFKPAGGADIHTDSATRTIRALGQDVMEGMRTAPPPAHKLAGSWPYAGISYLREWLFAADSLPISLLSRRSVVRSDTLSRIADLAIAVWPRAGAESEGTALGAGIRNASGAVDRRQATALYRRAIAVLSEGVSALTANALWLMASAHREEEPPADLKPVLWETLRLLPPAWMLWRKGGDEYTDLDPSIGPGDDIALFPLLMHRDPEFWSAPLEFRPERWTGVGDPEKVPAYMPFGFDGARCWARHLVVPLAERLLGVVLANRLTIPSTQRVTHIPLRSLLSVRVEVEAAA
jgi:hypothetical protein